MALAFLHRAGDEATRAQAMAFPAYGDALEIGAERGHEMIAGLCAWTQPSGPLPRPVYEQLRDELLADIAAAGPLDMVMLDGAGRARRLAVGIHDARLPVVGQRTYGVGVHCGA